MFSNEFFTFVTGQATDVGCVREINEDSFLTRPESGVWVVADGMGGHAAGDYASQLIVRELFSVGVPASADDLQARFMERLVRANDLIFQHAAELGAGSIGATVAALLIYDGDFACIWSGDSRVYLLRAGQISQQTRDHTEVQLLLDSGTISAEEAVNWPRKNVITRAVGVTQAPECDVVGGKIELGDRFLLCSDGLIEYLSDAEIAGILANHEPQDACDHMVQETLNRGAKDNVTVIIIHCQAPPAAQPDEYTLDEATDIAGLL